MANNFGDFYAKDDTSPATIIELVTPSDTEEFRIPTRGLSFSTAGDLRVTAASANPAISGSTVTIPEGSLAAGVIHPIRVNKVWDTGTSAADIVAYF